MRKKGKNQEKLHFYFSEIIHENGTSTYGPNLPMPLYDHAMASFNSSLSMIISGFTCRTENQPDTRDMFTNKTWFYNHADQNFKPGPDSITARNWHTAGVITDRVTGKKIMVVAGGYGNQMPENEGYSMLSSTELFISNEWVEG